MGTVSLVFGLILIIIGFGIGVTWLMWVPSSEHPFEINVIIGSLVIFPFIVIGGLLIRKYDNDKKKE